jgi:hypothetical protein
LCSRYAAGLMAPIKPFRIFPSSAALSSELPAMFRSEIGQVLGDHHLSLDLNQRSSGSRQEKMELVRRETRLPFGNVDWNRNRRSSQLPG